MLFASIHALIFSGAYFAVAATVKELRANRIRIIDALLGRY